MKPHRIRMAHNLLLNYGLYRKMEIYRPSSASFEELCKFHSEDYVRFLRTITPDNMGEHTKQMQRFNVGEDCPVFDGMYAFCQARSTASNRSALRHTWCLTRWCLTRRLAASAPGAAPAD